MTQALFQRLADLTAAEVPCVVATVIGAGGSTPRLAGAQMVITASEAWGTIGGGAFEWMVTQRAHDLLADASRRVDRVETHLVRDLGMCCGGRMEVFMQKHCPAPRLRIYGAGHVGTALAHAATPVGLSLVVVDERAEWADPARFPEPVEVVDADPLDHVRAHPPTAADRVLVVTHDHGLDEALVRALLTPPEGSGAGWIGLIGSRGKWARFKNRLEARGISPEALARVRCPVGVDIGAISPEEIAVSVLAELVAHHRQGARRG